MCKDRNCVKRHHRNCKYFEKYNRCRFGEYCASFHRKNPLVTEINKLKINCYIVADDLNDKRNEVFDLKKKVEALDKVVSEIVNIIESITTPTKKGSEKRRKVLQTPPPLLILYKHSQSLGQLPNCTKCSANRNKENNVNANHKRVLELLI